MAAVQFAPFGRRVPMQVKCCFYLQELFVEHGCMNRICRAGLICDADLRACVIHISQRLLACYHFVSVTRIPSHDIRLPLIKRFVCLVSVVGTCAGSRRNLHVRGGVPSDTWTREYHTLAISFSAGHALAASMFLFVAFTTRTQCNSVPLRTIHYHCIDSCVDLLVLIRTQNTTHVGRRNTDNRYDRIHGLLRRRSGICGVCGADFTNIRIRIRREDYLRVYRTRLRAKANCQTANCQRANRQQPTTTADRYAVTRYAAFLEKKRFVCE